MTIEIFLRSHMKPIKSFLLFSKQAEVAILSYILTPPKKLRRKCLIVTNFLSTNKQYVKIKLMQNEINRWSISLVKTKYW